MLDKFIFTFAFDLCFNLKQNKTDLTAQKKKTKLNFRHYLQGEFSRNIIFPNKKISWLILKIKNSVILNKFEDIQLEITFHE